MIMLRAEPGTIVGLIDGRRGRSLCENIWCRSGTIQYCTIVICLAIVRPLSPEEALASGVHRGCGRVAGIQLQEGPKRAC